MSTTAMLERLKMLMPPWFGQPSGQPTPVLDGFLTGPGAALSWVQDLIDFVKQQTRLSTMSGGFLDLFAQDYFGTDLLRKTDEDDAAYRFRIKSAFFHVSNTEAAILAAIAGITSVVPTVIKWWDPGKTGVWDGAAGAGRMYWDVNTVATPMRWTSPLLKHAPGVYIEIAVSDQETRRLLFVALRRYKAAGVKIYIKFTA